MSPRSTDIHGSVNLRTTSRYRVPSERRRKTDDASCACDLRDAAALFICWEEIVLPLFLSAGDTSAVYLLTSS